MDKKIQVADKTYWIGYIDDRKVPFHRLTLEKGTTYNSYLLFTEKPTVIDTVDISFGKQFVETIGQYIAPEEIQYIIINHVEPDHSGGLPALANKAKNATIVTTELGAKELKEMYKLHHREFMVIQDGDTLDIGGKTLKFFETPYLHTEETMITYCIEDKVLYPCDQFSSHVATYQLFDDLAKEDIMPDFRVYYQLIMHPHRPYVQDMIEKIKDLEINIIAPSHGYILRSDAKKYIRAYDEMSRPNQDTKKALIIYSTMTGNTKAVANDLADGLKHKGISVQIMNAQTNSNIEAIKEAILTSDAILFGSSTRYADMVGSLESILQELKEMDLEHKIGIAFGSYGWSGEAIEVIQDYLKQSNLKVIDSGYMIKTTGMDHLQFPIRVKFKPEKNEKEKLFQAAQAIGDLLLG
ncbi:FprA family A-type flavoprotein [Clostridium formicaceticum]|uniref:FprA family A-type flavoprotein n=1 Tax=Clostridium formicaceticum TaxID=1497 RepID=A0AAC9RN57_9CLOT|nr:FprA family A-type flavoprotein [Clostridium formicaceticum]AOY78046.1 FprA family A-type flavoprotein [Clostridium formicaceticum]ARE88682.1 Nitric oxide reductase [Clostridium formicaceticum]